VRLARGHRAGTAAVVRRPVADDQLLRALVSGTRPEPGRRVQLDGRPRSAPDVRTALSQHRPVGVQRVRRLVYGVVAEARRRAKTVRHSDARPPVCGVRQQPLRHRSLQACTAKLCARRRTTFGKAKKLANRT